MRLLADENFNGKILRGLLLRLPQLDVVRVQDLGLEKAADPVILEWAARESRIVLSHDVSTMPDFAYERIGRGASMPGMVLIESTALIGPTIEAIVILVECSLDGELEGEVRRLFP